MLNAAQAWFEEGNALAELQRFGEAVEAYDKALSYVPGNITLLCSRAAALLGIGDTERALIDLNAAIAAEPKLEWPHRLRSAALLGSGAATEAIREALIAVDLAPAAPESRHQLFIVQRALGLRADAWRTAHRLAHLAPDAAQSHVALAQVQSDYGQWFSAEEEFRKVIAIGGETAGLLNAVAVCLEHQGRQQEAMEVYARAHTLQPSNASAANLARLRSRFVQPSLNLGIIAFVVITILSALIAEALQLTENETTLVVGCSMAVAFLLAFVHWRRRVRQLPPALMRVAAPPPDGARRRRLGHVALIPVTLYLLVCTIAACAIAVSAPEASVIIATIICALLTAAAAYGWWRTR